MVENGLLGSIPHLFKLENLIKIKDIDIQLTGTENIGTKIFCYGSYLHNLNEKNILSISPFDVVQGDNETITFDRSHIFASVEFKNKSFLKDKMKVRIIFL